MVRQRTIIGRQINMSIPTNSFADTYLSAHSFANITEVGGPMESALHSTMCPYIAARDVSF